MQVLAHLWLGAPAPVEYIDLCLCREVYHCTPNELDEVDAERIFAHLACLDAETEWYRLRAWDQEQNK